ncbi:uncharacterized protein A1O9_07158 [Exophiala aquamarina CBS 119918]|uniref:Uncharacterized protein n=1 Tax=Exophiala aquamarina CBS 119918 TaxID=1182545 RepID=A0A072PCE8_9EURO|nr:uncharacterized protein A1O9_07158 [Exophiala aquamarina CBS 119918]KEF56968.1 hypothetical protein A1O9_07158 [Exophiala aquamarina CBS 119918]
MPALATRLTTPALAPSSASPTSLLPPLSPPPPPRPCSSSPPAECASLAPPALLLAPSPRLFPDQAGAGRRPLRLPFPLASVLSMMPRHLLLSAASSPFWSSPTTSPQPTLPSLLPAEATSRMSLTPRSMSTSLISLTPSTSWLAFLLAPPPSPARLLSILPLARLVNLRSLSRP